MRPTSNTFSAAIAVPLDRVFDLLSNPARFPEWFPGCVSAEAKGPIRKGARIQVSFPAERSTELEVVDFTPPTTIGWADRGDRRGSRTFFQLYFGGGATTLSVKDVWEPKGILDLVKGRIMKRRDSKRFFDSVINNLRNAVTK
jgi:uncharacterized protein YndB with AHSA1/START domain